MLVDTGFGTLPILDMVRELTNLPVFLVNTHTDKDHTGGNKDFNPVYMHPAEMDHYKSALPDGCQMEHVHPLWEGQILDLGHWKFEVILTPGHTGHFAGDTGSDGREISRAGTAPAYAV